MIVVSNTSPLTNLASIGQFDLLRQLYQKLYIPAAVWQELNAQGKHWPGRDQTAASEWIELRQVTNTTLVEALQRDLDRGEAESIALALEVDADLILMDEQEGRHAAQRLGLKTLGVVGTLLEAKVKGLITEIRVHLDALCQVAGFYLSDAVYQRALVLAGEHDKPSQ